MLPKPIILSNNKEVLIRLAIIEDAPSLLNLKRSYIEESQTIPLTLAEYGNDLDQERNLIDRYNSSPNSCLLVAESDGLLVGNIDLTGHQRQSMNHTAVLGMGLVKEVRGLGLGYALMEEVINYCKAETDVKVIWLDVFDNNTSAKALYKKQGFIQCGYIPNFFYLNGVYIDKVTMARKI